MIKRIMAAGAVVAAAAGLLTVGAAPAAAGTVTLDYLCFGFGSGQVARRTFDITITVPATATRGQPVTVTATVASRYPVSRPHPAGDWQGTHTITLGGAGTGSLTVAPMSSPPLQPGQVWLTTGSTQTTFSTAGTVTFRPDVVTHSRPGSENCRPYDPETPPVAATTQVS